MDFKDTLEPDLENVFFNDTEFAEDVTVNPSSAPSYNAIAIFDKAFIEIDPDTEAQILSTQPILRVQEHKLESDLNNDPSATFTIRGDEYKMITYETDGVGTALIQLHVL